MTDEDRVKLGEGIGLYGCSETGLRPKDEDFIAGFRLETSLGWKCRAAILCDGMGGGERGEEASEMAAKTFLDSLREALGPKPPKGLLARFQSRESGAQPARPEVFVSPLSRQQFWEEIFALCHDRVRALSEGAKVGTTLTAVVVAEKKPGKVLWADLVHIGDTRCYLLGDKPGDCQLLTEDNSLTGEMVQGGYIQLHEIPDTHGHNVLTRSIGMDEMPGPSVTQLDLKGGDRVLLCCDGVWGPLHTEDGLWLPDAGLGSQGQVEAWVDEALNRGSTDNCSALLIEV